MSKFRKTVLHVCALVCALFATGCAGLQRNPQSVQVPQRILELIDENHEIVDKKVYYGLFFVACREKGVENGTVFIYHDSIVESIKVLDEESTKWEIKISVTIEGVQRKISLTAPGINPYKWVKLERKGKGVEVAATPEK